MEIDTDESPPADELRRHAEECLAEKTAKLYPPGTKHESRRFIHELEVQQIELEMQNQELCTYRDEAEKTLESYSDLYDFTPVGYVTLDQQGSIKAVNLTAVSLLESERSRLLGQFFRNFIATAYRPEFADFLSTVFACQGKKMCEVALLNEANNTIFVQIIAMAAESRQECRIILIDNTERKKTEEALKLSESDLASAQAISHTGSWRVIFSDSGEQWSGSEELSRIYGYPPDTKVTMRTCIDHMHPEDRESVKAAWSAAMEGVGPTEWEHRIIVDGQNRWLRVKFQLVSDITGRLREVRGISQDITYRKRSEEALQKSRNFHAEIEKIGKVGGWELDLETMEQAWTEEVYRIHEVDMDFKPTLTSGIEFYTPASRPIINKLMKQAIEHGKPFDAELDIITAKGNLRNVHAIGKADLDERRIFGFYQDITARKQIEEALKNSEERYRRLFEMGSDTVLMLDCETGQFIDVNSAALSMYGYTKEEFLRLKHVDISAEPDKTVSSIVNNEINVPIRMHRKKDGTLFPVEIAGSYFKYLGRMVHVAAIRDISSRVQTEENLVELNQKLRALSGHLQSVQEQERLAISRDIHDDVGQSLTVLKLDLTWLEQNLAPVENDIAVRMKAMRVTIDQISAIVQRIAANLRPPLLDNQGLSAAIEWHVNEFSRRSGIECFIMLNEDSDSIDEETATTVMRIVQESLTNIVRHAFATEVGISLCQRDGNLILEISDNGCGITREQIDDLNSFGLLGMQERAKLCKGEFKISGTPGCGTILQLTIPLDFFGGKV